MKNIIIGIDISSKTLDICVKDDTSVIHLSIENSLKTIKTFFRKYSSENVIVAMENTGRYNWNLYEVLKNFTFRVYVIPPLHLKKSIGLTRGKNDKVDALRISSFIEKHYQETQQWQPCPESIMQIKILLTDRRARIKMKTALKRQQRDYKLMKGAAGLDKELLKWNKAMIKTIENQIDALEKKIELVISQDSKLNVQSKLLQSVPGVGKVTTWMFLAKTVGFTTITDARKMACYSGVVPFDFQSGTSIMKKPRISNLADKSMKSVLHLAAMSAIRLENDLAIYYKRKVAEGKNKMSVLNAIRNKIIHRVFAVIKNNKPYQNNLVLS
jgi:transposase